MTTPPIPDWFKRLLAINIAKFPNFKPGQSMAAAYWDELHMLKPPIVKRALEFSISGNREFFPTATMVKHQATILQKNERTEWQEPNYERPALPEASAAPSTPAEMQRYIEEVDTLPMSDRRKEIEKLVRLWECQSRAGQLGRQEQLGLIAKLAGAIGREI